MRSIDESVELLQKLSLMFGPSGCEDIVRDAIKGYAEGRADEIFTDRLGNLICKMSFGEEKANKKIIEIQNQLNLYMQKYW